jgi:biopolymer transport protein ExbD
MARRPRLPEPRERSKIDASLAIVNIVLLLIFFFLAAGSILNSASVEIALPETIDLPLDRLPEPLLVIGADRAMTLDGTALAPGSLADALIDDPILHVLADRDTNAVTVLETLAAEKLIAVEIRLVTLHTVTGDGG